MTLLPEALQSAVEILSQGRGQPPVPIGNLPPEAAPRNIAEAMQLQEVLNQRLTQQRFGEVVGTKIGCTTQVMQEYLGMTHPCSGAIFDSTVHHRAGRFEFDSFLHVGVECEIAARLSSQLRAHDAPHSLESVMPAVESIHAAIEIVDDRYVDFENRVPDWKTWVADDFFGAGIVLGDPVTDWHSLDLPQLHGEMRINGESMGTGQGRDIINSHPLEALVWLANSEAERDNDLPADWIVMLGSVVQTKWVRQGDTVEVELDALGMVTADFA